MIVSATEPLFQVQPNQ